MKPSIRNHSIIVCDRDYFPMIFRIKAKDPSFDAKLLDRNELIDRASLSFLSNPVPILMKKGIGFSKARKYASLIRSGEIDKNEELKKAYGYVESLASKDELGPYFLKSKPLYLLEMDEDAEIRNILERAKIPFEAIHLSDLGLEEQPFPHEVMLFEDKFKQFFYIYADIRKRILENPEDKKRIRILISDQSDVFYAKEVSSLLSVPSFVKSESPLISDPLVKKKVDAIREQRTFDADIDGQGPSLSVLDEQIEEYGLKELPFEFAYASLIEIVSSISIVTSLDDAGITVTRKTSFDEDSITYVTNFRYGDFYKVADDKNVLSDDELIGIGCNPSYYLTSLNRRKALNYLKHNGVVMLSRVQRHLTDSIYDSQLVSELGLSTRLASLNEGGIYTKKAASIYRGMHLDSEFYNDREGDYRSYTHEFGGIGDIDLTPKSGNWSVTKLESYINCPFKYLLGELLPSRDEDRHAAWRGTFIHKVMEKVNHADFSLDEAIEEAAMGYQGDVEKAGFEFDEREKANLEIVAHWTRRAALGARENLVDGGEGPITSIIPHDSDHENKIQWKIDEYSFSGKIDSILFSQGEASSYYTIIDYKSGSERFKPHQVFLGKSIQLPLYAYAIETSEDPSKYTGGHEFGGFGIRGIYASSPKKFAGRGDAPMGQDAFVKNARLYGAYLEKPDYVKSIDRTAFNKKGDISMTSSSYLGGGMAFKRGEAPKEKDEPSLEEVIEDAKTAAKETIAKIEGGEFPIAPSSLDLEKGSMDSLSCKFCPYGDVCYVNKKKDSRDYSRIIKERFSKN